MAKLKEWIPMWAIPVVAVLAIGTVWLRLHVLRVTYEVNQTNKLMRNARSELDALELEVARLKSPRRLQELAKSKFNLAPPQSGQVVRLEAEEAKR